MSTSPSTTDTLVLPFTDFSTIVVKHVVNSCDTGKMDVYVQTTDDGGTTWYDVAHLPNTPVIVSNANAHWAKIFVNGLSNSTPSGAAADGTIGAGQYSGLPILTNHLRVKWVSTGIGAGAFQDIVTMYVNDQSSYK